MQPTNQVIPGKIIKEQIDRYIKLLSQEQYEQALSLCNNILLPMLANNATQCRAAELRQKYDRYGLEILSNVKVIKNYLETLNESKKFIGPDNSLYFDKFIKLSDATQKLAELLLKILDNYRQAPAPGTFNNNVLDELENIANRLIEDANDYRAQALTSRDHLLHTPKTPPKPTRSAPQIPTEHEQNQQQAVISLERFFTAILMNKKLELNVTLLNICATMKKDGLNLDDTIALYRTGYASLKDALLQESSGWQFWRKIQLDDSLRRQILALDATLTNYDAASKVATVAS